MWITKVAAFSLLSLTAFGQFRLTKASVIIFPVTDIAKATAFYRDQLGLTLARTHEDFVFFDAGGITIALRGGKAAPSPADLSATELSFEVEHVKEAYDALRAKGVKFRVAPRIITGTTWATDFRDPDGHVLSIVGPE
jgi:catechol 2,3-dioxygenase-like lactoylglutathione lyase family enzyme